MASTLLASTAIMLSSVIAVLMTGSAGGKGIGSSQSAMVIGDSSQLGFSIKFFSILVCFLLAFLLNVVSVRYYSHASILINVPIKCNKEMADKFFHQDDQQNCVTTEFVGCTVNRGSYFWSLGLRAYYFSFPLFMWIFGPIPMFLCCWVLVFMLYFLDVSFDLGYHVSSHDQDEDEEGQVITSRT